MPQSIQELACSVNVPPAVFFFFSLRVCLHAYLSILLLFPAAWQRSHITMRVKGSILAWYSMPSKRWVDASHSAWCLSIFGPVPLDLGTTVDGVDAHSSPAASFPSWQTRPWIDWTVVSCQLVELELPCIKWTHLKGVVIVCACSGWSPCRSLLLACMLVALAAPFNAARVFIFSICW